MNFASPLVFKQEWDGHHITFQGKHFLHDSPILLPYSNYHFSSTLKPLQKSVKNSIIEVRQI